MTFKSDTAAWKRHFENMANGSTDGKSRGFYTLKKADAREERTDTPQLITTRTQAQVKQAKRKVERELNPPKKRKTVIIKDFETQ